MYKCLEKITQISSATSQFELTEITAGILHFYKMLPISSEWQAETNANLIP